MVLRRSAPGPGSSAATSWAVAATAVALVVAGGTTVGLVRSASEGRVPLVAAGPVTDRVGAVTGGARPVAGGPAQADSEAAGPRPADPAGASGTAAPSLSASGTATVAGGGLGVGQPASVVSTESAGATSPAGGSPAWTGPSGTPSATAAPAPGTAPDGAAEQVPAPGTYTYATSGNQQISLLGRSTYPARTPVVVSRSGCGDSATWKSSPGDSETLVECPVAGGLRILSESTTVGAGGYSTTQTFDCGADAFIPVTAGTPGRTWQWVCTSPVGERASHVVRFVGRQTTVVGGIPVSTVEVSIASALSGPEQGRAWADCWLTSNATPVKEIGGGEVSQNGVTYTSSDSLQLVSLAPTR